MTSQSDPNKTRIRPEGSQWTELMYVESDELRLEDLRLLSFDRLLSLRKRYILFGLCESGRFLLEFQPEDPRDRWALVDRSHTGEDESAEIGGNTVAILAEATVKWERAWEAVSFFIKNDGEIDRGMWERFESLESEFSRDVIIT